MDKWINGSISYEFIGNGTNKCLTPTARSRTLGKVQWALDSQAAHHATTRPEIASLNVLTVAKMTTLESAQVLHSTTSGACASASVVKLSADPFVSAAFRNLQYVEKDFPGLVKVKRS
jgi:hypothetical protein